MSLFDRAIQDAKLITNGDFAVPIVFSHGGNTANIKGWTTKHHIGFDTDGNMVNSKTVNVTVSESDLTDAGYPVRDTNGEVNLRGHLVTVKDSTQTTDQFQVSQYFPDERLGLITLILKEFV